jgi:hypothetical protein
LKERKAKTVQVYLELEDNCGAILSKKKLEIPVVVDVNLDPKELEARFNEFLATKFPTKFEV